VSRRKCRRKDAWADLNSVRAQAVWGEPFAPVAPHWRIKFAYCPACAIIHPVPAGLSIVSHHRSPLPGGVGGIDKHRPNTGDVLFKVGDRIKVALAPPHFGPSRFERCLMQVRRDMSFDVRVELQLEEFKRGPERRLSLPSPLDLAVDALGDCFRHGLYLIGPQRVAMLGKGG